MNKPTETEEKSSLFTVKMRASLLGAHISGAEKIVDGANACDTAAKLVSRALTHPKGSPDFINVKIERQTRIERLESLKVTENVTLTPEEGRVRAAELLKSAGITRIAEIFARFPETYGLRGAMLLDADTLERLDTAPDLFPGRDPMRGVRATNMDDADSAVKGTSEGKNHYAEAIVLATKVANAPGIVGEICVSDDPDYVTGYVATKEIGYQRLSVMKAKGDPCGGRVFLYHGPRSQIPSTVEFLEKTAVLVENVPILQSKWGQSPAIFRFVDSSIRRNEWGQSPISRIVESSNRRFQWGQSPEKWSSIEAELSSIREAGLWRRVGTDPESTGTVPVKKVVMSANDYLGLANDPRVMAAFAEGSKWGAGSTGSRLTTGTVPVHLELERRLARFKGTEEALLYATGYMANVGVISAIVKKGDVIFSDKLNHASIIDGCRLSGAEVKVYGHLDYDDLERQLAADSGHRRRLVVSDAVFSMDGDMLDLPRYLEICSRHNAFSMIDEAHATGVIGSTGRGLAEHFYGDRPQNGGDSPRQNRRIDESTNRQIEGDCPHADITVGTLSKALGSEGGFVCGSRRLIDYLVNRSRSFIFSTAPAPGNAAAAMKALEILEAEPERVARLRDNVAFFVAELARYNIKVKTDSAIVPIPVPGRVPVKIDESTNRRIDESGTVPSERRAVEVAERLRRKGFVIPAIRYPTVALGSARLRVAISASHTREELAAAALLISEAIF